MVHTSELKRIAEGREAEIYEWEPGTVLRLFRDGRGSTAVEHERAAMEAVRAVAPLVPRVFGITQVMSRPGIIMEHIDGPDLFSVIAKKPWTVWRAGQITGEIHARLNCLIAPLSIEPLRERGRREVPASGWVPQHIVDWGLSELEALPDGDRLLHGDFHPGNILMAAGGPIVIDWPNASRGNPDADLGRTLLMIRMGSLPPGSPLVIRAGARFARSVLRASYLRAYRRTRQVDMQSVRRWEMLRAVDRLADNVIEERSALLGIVEAAMAAHG